MPRDECFSEVKELTFSAKTVYSVLHAVLPSLDTALLDANLGFPYFTAVDSLYNEGINVPALKQPFSLSSILPRLVKSITNVSESLLRFETPAVYECNLPLNLLLPLYPSSPLFFLSFFLHNHRITELILIDFQTTSSLGLGTKNSLARPLPVSIPVA